MIKKTPKSSKNPTNVKRPLQNKQNIDSYEHSTKKRCQVNPLKSSPLFMRKSRKKMIRRRRNRDAFLI